MPSQNRRICLDVNEHVKDVLDELVPHGQKGQFVERCLFLDPEFKRAALAAGIKGPTRRQRVGNPEFGPGYQGRWAKRDDSEATFHELEPDQEDNL